MNDYLERAKQIINEGIIDVKEITRILKNEGFKIKQNEKEYLNNIKTQIKLLDLSKEKPKAQLKGQEERKPSVIDNGDHYIITSSAGDRSITITESRLKEFKKLYCGGSKLTINQVCRNMDLTRRDVILIKTAFGITHDDIQYTDKDLKTRSTDELVRESLEGLKDAYFKKFQQEEINQMRRELTKYHRKDYYIEKIDSMIKEGFKYKPIPILEEIKNNSSLMLEVSIVDAHLGKLAWRPETGENFDHRIAQKRFISIISDVINRTKDMKFNKIIFPIGNDFFNFDNIDGTTTGGTRQDNDLRWTKLFEVGINLLINAIEELSKKAKVEAFLVPGNHDFTTSYYAIKVIQHHFRNDVNVIINADPMTRKYIEFGKCLIGFTHLDKEKNRIFGNMQIEAAKSWGRTKHREWHGAHLHSEQVQEKNGVKVRNLTSVTALDAWHSQSGYVGAIATSQSFIWDKEKGLINILYSTIERDR